jgi:hypothetical protein
MCLGLGLTRLEFAGLRLTRVPGLESRYPTWVKVDPTQVNESFAIVTLPMFANAKIPP